MPQVALELVDPALVPGDDLDELLFLAELLEQEALDGRTVLALFLEEEVARVGEAPQQIVDLHPESLELHLLFVKAVVHLGQVALPDVPDLGQPGDLCLARLEVVAQHLELALGCREQRALRRERRDSATRSALREAMVWNVRPRNRRSSSVMPLRRVRRGTGGGPLDTGPLRGSALARSAPGIGSPDRTSITALSWRMASSADSNGSLMTSRLCTSCVNAAVSSGIPR